MESRLRPVRRKTFAMLAVGLAISAPWAGAWTLVPMLAAIGVYWLTERLVPRFKQPAILFFGAWVSVEAIIAISVALSGTLRETSVCLLAVPIMTLNARFSSKGIVVGGALAIVAIAAVLVSGDPQAILREPPVLIAPVMLVVAWAMLSTPLMRSDIEHRHGARIDQLSWSPPASGRPLTTSPSSSTATCATAAM